MTLPCGEAEGAVLVAVERANGGELAPLPQVLWRMRAFIPAALMPGSDQFADSAATLLELDLIEWREGQLGLSVKGRKLLRRSGLGNDPRHVLNVTRLLAEFDPDDRVGEVPEGPSAEEVRLAMEEAAGGEAPQTYGGAEPLPATTGSVFPFSVPAAETVPLVPPSGSEEPARPPAPAGISGAPAHPLLERLFRRPRARHDPEP